MEGRIFFPPLEKKSFFYSFAKIIGGTLEKYAALPKYIPISALVNHTIHVCCGGLWCFELDIRQVTTNLDREKIIHSGIV